VDIESGQDPFAGLKSGDEEYSVYDANYERIGRVDDVFLDERDAVSYIGVEMGFFGTNSTLVPVEIIRVNDRRRLIEVAAEAETIKHAPHFGNEEIVSPELEDRVRTYFGLEPFLPLREPYPPGDTGRFGPDDRVDTEPGERMEAQNRLTGEPAEAPLAGERFPEDRWDRETREGGVTIHRRRI
jgi:PRC-barrel domain